MFDQKLKGTKLNYLGHLGQKNQMLEGKELNKELSSIRV